MSDEETQTEEAAPKTTKKARPSIKAKKPKSTKAKTIKKEKVEPIIDDDGVIEGTIVPDEEDTMTDTTADKSIPEDELPKDEDLRATREEAPKAEKQDNDFMDRDWGKIGTRVFFMIIIGFLSYVVLHLALVLALTQLIVSVIQDETNETISGWMNTLGDYLKQSFAYLSMQTEAKPFPFDREDL